MLSHSSGATTMGRGKRLDRYEVEALYGNGDVVRKEFKEDDSAIEFLHRYQLCCRESGASGRRKVHSRPSPRRCLREAEWFSRRLGLATPSSNESRDERVDLIAEDVAVVAGERFVERGAAGVGV